LSAKTKYIFVTGGVISGIGKGISVASIGQLLKSQGISVSLQKLDPYLNVDPGTMSPYQHGEVFVTHDGGETDLDLGHYERFVDVELTRASNVTAGQIYSEVIAKERRGEFLGGTIQIVPHVTNAIKERIKALTSDQDIDVVVVEVGGTVGDIEGQPFIEAIRQMRKDVGRDNVFYIHVTLLPDIRATGEIKTKPTQQSVRELRGMGIQPDAIICRSDKTVSDSIKEKIAFFCDVEPSAVIALPTVDTIYEVPLILQEQGLAVLLAERLDLPIKHNQLKEWEQLVETAKTPSESILIAVVGKYADLPEAYLSVKEAIFHAGLHHRRNVQIEWIPSESIESEGASTLLSKASGIIVPGGFGPRGINGMIQTATYARENLIPYLGLCLGMQIMVVEFARSVLGLLQANSTEFAPATPDPVIDLLPDQHGITDMGGTMRLGSYPCQLQANTKAQAAYGSTMVEERHRHRFEVNNNYRESLEKHGLLASGVSPDGTLVEIGEIMNHPFMVGSQFHPEFRSRPGVPHPLFREFLNVALQVVHEGTQHPFPIS
jgi:CTP synthase